MAKIVWPVGTPDAMVFSRVSCLKSYYRERWETVSGIWNPFWSSCWAGLKRRLGRAFCYERAMSYAVARGVDSMLVSDGVVHHHAGYSVTFSNRVTDQLFPFSVAFAPTAFEWTVSAWLDGHDRRWFTKAFTIGYHVLDRGLRHEDMKGLFSSLWDAVSAQNDVVAAFWNQYQWVMMHLAWLMDEWPTVGFAESGGDAVWYLPFTIYSRIRREGSFRWMFGYFTNTIVLLLRMWWCDTSAMVYSALFRDRVPSFCRGVYGLDQHGRGGYYRWEERGLGWSELLRADARALFYGCSGGWRAARSLVPLMLWLEHLKMAVDAMMEDEWRWCDGIGRRRFG